MHFRQLSLKVKNDAKCDAEQNLRALQHKTVPNTENSRLLGIMEHTYTLKRWSSEKTKAKTWMQHMRNSSATQRSNVQKLTGQEVQNRHRNHSAANHSTSTPVFLSHRTETAKLKPYNFTVIVYRWRRHGSRLILRRLRQREKD